MDLQVAAVKYAADALPSAHLPAIAAQALEKGYYSDALAALAFETEPIMSDVGPLFERALADCGIQIPAPATPGNDSSPTPISTRDSQFLRSAHNVLQESGEIFVLQRFAYTAGAGSGCHNGLLLRPRWTTRRTRTRSAMNPSGKVKLPRSN